MSWVHYFEAHDSYIESDNELVRQVTDHSFEPGGAQVEMAHIGLGDGGSGQGGVGGGLLHVEINVDLMSKSGDMDLEEKIFI